MSTVDFNPALTGELQEPTSHDEHLFLRMLGKRAELQSAIARRDAAQTEAHEATARLTKRQVEVDSALGALEAIYTEFKEGASPC